MNEPRKCNRCGYAISAETTKCPICGTRILTVTTVKRLGWVQLILGLFIVAMMGTITVFLAPIMLTSGSATGSENFSGTPAQAGVILLLFGVVIVFGLTSIVNGLYQIVTGRRNKWILIITFVLVFILLVVLAAVLMFPGK